MPGIVEKRHIRIGRLQCEFVDGALHGRQIEINLERDLEAERLQRRGDVFSVVRRIGERRNGFVGAVADDERKAALRPRRQGREAEDDGEKRRCRPPPCPAQRLGRRFPSNQRASPIDWRRHAQFLDFARLDTGNRVHFFAAPQSPPEFTRATEVRSRAPATTSPSRSSLPRVWGSSERTRAISL